MVLLVGYAFYYRNVFSITTESYYISYKSGIYHAKWYTYHF